MAFDGTFLMVLLSFVAFMLLMRTLYFEPVRQIKAARAIQQEENQKNMALFLAESKTLAIDYDAKLKDAHQQAQALILQNRRETKEEIATMLQGAREDAGQLIEEAMADLAQWREKTYQELASERQTLVKTLVDKIVMNNNDHKALAMSPANASD